MTQIAYTIVAILVGIGAAMGVIAAINGALARDWRFALGGICLALFLGINALTMVECAKGKCVGEDPTVPSRR